MTDPVFDYFPGGEAQDSIFDLLIANCGYEERSAHVATRLEGRFAAALVYAYGDHQVHSYRSNKGFYSRFAEVHVCESADSFRIRLQADLESHTYHSGLTRIAADISSLDRERLGILVSLLAAIGRGRPLEVEFFYAFGTFDSLDEAQQTTVLSNRPLEGFEGWTHDPSLPVACVIGLGFENMLALAALEMLEPTRTVALIAESDDPRFQVRVRMENATLMRSDDVAEVRYPIADPFLSLHIVEEVVHALRTDNRVVLVPLGPKMFALLCILVALEYGSSVSVWRVSADSGRLPTDRKAVGPITSLIARSRVIVA